MLVASGPLCAELNKYATRYSSLKTHFDTMYLSALEALSVDEPPVEGVRFLPDLAHDYFDVLFIGERVRFSFVMNDQFKGVVSVFLVDVITGNVEDDVGMFTFTGQGETSLQTPLGDVAGMVTKGDATHIVLDFVLLAVKGEN